MANRLSRLANAVYIPAVKPVPGRDAYCIRVSIPSGLEGGGYSGGGSSGKTTLNVLPTSALSVSPVGQYGGNPVAGGGFAALSPNGSALVVGNQAPVKSPPSALRPRLVGSQLCYPEIKAVAGSPARVDYLYNAGWNAGARSVSPVPEFGQFSATLSYRLVATQVGLARRGFDHTYQYMSHSIVARPGEWSVVERGVTKAKGALSAGARLTIRRMGGRVSYHADGEELYVSEAPLVGEVYGAALLYSLGDGVEDPVITKLADNINCTVVAPMWKLLGTDASLVFIDGVAPRWEMLAQLSAVPGAMRLVQNTPALRLLGSDRPLAFVVGEAPVWSLRATLGRKERIPSQMVGVVPPPMLRAVLISGSKLSLRAEVPPPIGLGADRQLMFVNAKKPHSAYIVAWEPYLPPGMIDGMDNLVSHDFTYLEAAILLLAVDSIEVGASADLTLVLELSAMDSLEITDTTSFGQLVEMLAMERLRVFSSTYASKRAALQYAVNALTGAPTTYDGYDFLSFASVGSETYGVRSDGLYRIGGATDNGEVINVLVDWGTSDFADNRVKRVDTAYVGVRTDGECYLRVRGDSGAERVYRVRGDGEVKRSCLGKGVAARSWSVSLEIVDASYAEIDSIELLVGVTQRRGFGHRTR